MDEKTLQKKTIPELKAMAAEKGITVSASIRKAALIQLLLQQNVPAAEEKKPDTIVEPAPEERQAEKSRAAEPAQPRGRSMSTQQRMGARTQPVQTFRTNGGNQQTKQGSHFNAETQLSRGSQGKAVQPQESEGAAKTRRPMNPSVSTDNGDRMKANTRRTAEPVRRNERPAVPTQNPAPAVPNAESQRIMTASKPSAAAREAMLAGDLGDGAGILEIHPDGYGFLRAENYLPGNHDVYVSAAQIRRFNLRTGDYIVGKTRAQQSENQSVGLIYITEVNGEDPERARFRKPFDTLIPVYPDQRLRMERTDVNDPSLRLIDIIAPIGKGQRGMIVSQPKAGKTTLLKKIANAITTNAPEVQLIVLLIDERPEEVTDMKRSITGEVVYSTFDEAPENHTRVSEMVLERAQRLVEQGRDVVILLDSITRLARAYNLVIPPTGRSLSGGLDPGALYRPKRFFGAARNIENGGSLTIIATALVDTGSRMDDIIFEEFKGTGNMELHLDRSLSERRVFPAVDVFKSGTRREDLLLTKEEQEGSYETRRMLSKGNPQETAEQLISFIVKTKDNVEYFQKIKGWMRAYEKDGYRLK